MFACIWLPKPAFASAQQSRMSLAANTFLQSKQGKFAPQGKVWWLPGDGGTCPFLPTGCGRALFAFPFADGVCTPFRPCLTGWIMP